MDTAVVSSKFQIVIPKRVRRRVRLQKGQLVAFETSETEIRLIVVPSLKELDGKFKELRKAPSRRELWDDENR